MQPKSIRILSAGAVEPGLVQAARAFEAQAAVRLAIDWATTPAIRARIESGELPDVLIVPAEAADAFGREGRLEPAKRIRIGYVGVGVAVRTGCPRPDIGTQIAFERTLLDADGIVFTRATSGIYVESLLKRLSLHDRLAARITRFTTGPEMMTHLIAGTGNEICLGAIVELRMFDGRGLAYVGALPEPLQRRTPYDALALAGSEDGEAVAFVRFLARAGARDMFAACGVEPDELR